MNKQQKRTAKKSQLDVRHHLRHALVPHKGNRYRPHLVRFHGVTAVLLLVVLMQIAYGFISYGRFEVLGRVSDISSAELLSDTNRERQAASLGALTVNPKLNDAAFAKAQDMIKNDYWAHVSPSGTTPWHWLGNAGYNYTVAGENLAKNYPDAQSTVNAWMNSQTHRDNILNEGYQEVGFAVVDGAINGRNTTLVVAFYGASVGEATVAGAEDEKSPIVFAAPVGSGSKNPLVYFGTALQSLSPATLGALVLLTLVAAVAVVAHRYRSKLPVAWRRSWRLHHGMYTFAAMVGMALVIVLGTGGGQI